MFIYLKNDFTIVVKLKKPAINPIEHKILQIIIVSMFFQWLIEYLFDLMYTKQGKKNAIKTEQNPPKREKYSPISEYKAPIVAVQKVERKVIKMFLLKE